MSGGVDSAVAAYLLKMQGYEVIGCTLKFGEKNNKCCLIDDAALIADKLQIDYITIDVSAEFEEKIVKEFINQYTAGLTPNPCPYCNIIKFGKLLQFAEDKKIDFISTGHYAICNEGNLYSAIEPRKDQSYFLAQMPKEYFNKAIFPLGSYSKKDIREIARNADIHVAEKKDSQDICFIENNYRDFLLEHGVPNLPGTVVNSQNEILTEHCGFFNYTIGQRFRFPGMKSRQFVYAIDINENKIYIGDESLLYSKKMRTSPLNILSSENLINSELHIKIRSKDNFYTGRILSYNNHSCEIEFENEVSSITPGQLAVFYKDIPDKTMQVVASGWITGMKLNQEGF